MDPFGLSLASFLILTMGLFILDYVLVKNYKSFKSGTNAFISKVLYIVWLVLTCFSQFYINLKSTTCKNLPVINTFTYTIVPNVIIMFLTLALIELFPGFLTPFSNTFGYLLAKLLNADGKLKAILQPEGKSKEVDQIYNNKALMINEFTVQNFTTMINGLKSSNILNKLYGDKDIENLYNLVVIKTMFSKFMWILALGLLVIQVSVTSMHNVDCAKTGASSSEADKFIKMGDEAAKEKTFKQI